MLPMNSSFLRVRDQPNCTVLDVNSSIPWDNPLNLVSHEAERAVYMMHSLALIPVLFLLGAPLNILNLAVFAKQGLGDRINMCLFSLALVDLLYLIFLFVFHTARAYWWLKEGAWLDAASRYVINTGLAGLYGISYGPYFISAIISTERCVCVLFPLKARQCISTKALLMVIVTGVGVVVTLRFVVLARIEVSCIFLQQTGTTEWSITLSEFYFKNKDLIDNLDSVFFGFIAVICSLLVVTITTIITAVRLHQVVNWRNRFSSSISTKEIGVVKMIMCLSVEFVILSFPNIILRFSTLIDTQLSAAGIYRNLYNVLVGLAEIASYASSVVNFFIYYFAGSKYRETLQRFLPLKLGNKTVV